MNADELRSELVRRLAERFPTIDAAWFEDSFAAYRRAAAPIDAEFKKAAAPTKAEADRKVAESESAYARRVSEAKSARAAAERAFKAAMYDAKVRRDAEVRTWLRECSEILAPLTVSRRQRLEPLRERRDCIWKAHREIWEELQSKS